VAAGGYIVQLMPGVTEDQAASIEAVIRDLPHPTKMLRDGDTPEQMLTRIFNNDLQILENKPVRFHCPCSRERAERALMLLGREELEALIEADSAKGASEVVCEFCTAVYTMTIPELKALLSSIN
jgi:molecular chaperone Hsp33